MSAKDSDIQSCGQCGASVYPEHVESGKAREINGKLHCTHCLVEYQKTHHADEPKVVGQSTMRAPGETDDFTPIAIDEGESMHKTSIDVHPMGGETFSGMEALQDDSALKRPLAPGGQGATRCRTFHAKLNDGAVGFMNKQINEWADKHPDVFIKYATSAIGVWEGKKADSHLIVTVFY